MRPVVSARVRGPSSLIFWLACVLLSEPVLRIAYAAASFPQSVGASPSAAALFGATALDVVALGWVFLVVPSGLVLAFVPARLRVTAAGLEWRWLFFGKVWSARAIDVVFGDVDGVGLVSTSGARLRWRRSLTESADLTALADGLRALLATPPERSGSPYRGASPS